MQHEIKRFGALMIAVNLLVPSALLAASFTGGRTPERMFGGEGNLITWFSSSQMIVIAIVAYMNSVMIRRLRGAGEPHAGRSWLWCLFAGAFVFLAADEQLSVHEWLRESVFVPSGMFPRRRYLEAGDVALYIYLAAGVALLVFLVKELGWKSLPMRLFICALALSAVIVFFDAIPYRVRAREWGISGNVNQPLEETAEIWAQLLFLLSFLAALHARVGSVERLQQHRVAG
jgi:hypothetical protein